MRPVFVGGDEPNQIHITLGRHPVSIIYYVSMTLLLLQELFGCFHTNLSLFAFHFKNCYSGFGT